MTRRFCLITGASAVISASLACSQPDARMTRSLSDTI
jgi:hypothetical protein